MKTALSSVSGKTAAMMTQPREDGKPFQACAAATGCPGKVLNMI